MKSLIAAAGLILVANAAALLHVAANRAGTPEAVVTLTEEQLSPVTIHESGVDLTVRWQLSKPWVSKADLEQLGFDCSVSPGTSDARVHYRRQPSRRGFVALENTPGNPELTLIAAAPTADILREKHPDPNRVLILPAILTIQGYESQLTAVVSDLPLQIHVPRPFSTQLQAHANAPYRLHLAFGQNHEPWVTGVDFPTTR